MTVHTVIGATGFIGGLLAARLRAEGHEVYSPARGDPDLLNRDLGHVFYCAGLTGDFMIKPFETVRAHVGLLAEVLENARFERLIYLSSTRLYDSLGARGGHEDGVLEFAPTAARNVYDLSKALGENLCLARSGGRAAVARIANVFDPEGEGGGFLSDLLYRARQQRAITLSSSPGAGRDYISIEDVISALLAMDQQAVHGIVNIATGQTLTNGRLAEIMATCGWTLTLTGQDAQAPTPTCDTGRLRALGIVPASAAELVRTTLLSLSGQAR